MENKELELNDKQTKELETLPVSKLMLRFTIPALTGLFINTMYNMVDRVFLGHYVGEEALAATTIVMPLMMICMAVSMLIAFGTNSQISIKLGEKKVEEAEKLLGQGWFLFVVTSIIFTILSLIFMDPLLRLFGASENILPLARTYATIIIIGSLTHEISFGANSFIRGEGNPKVAMNTMIIGGLTNLVLDYFFVAVFGWGIAGAALATVIGFTLSAIWVFNYYRSGKSLLKLKRKHFKIHPGLLPHVLIMGSPNFLMQITGSIQSTLLNNQLLKYGGDTAISVMGIISSFFFLLFMPIIGMSQGMQPVVGYNFGAKQFTRVRSSLFISYTVSTIICTILFFIVQQWPELMFKVFIGNAESEIFLIGPKAIKDTNIFLPAFGFIILTIHYFQFTGRPILSLSLTLIRQLGFLIPFAIIFPKYLGLTGVWYALSTSDFCGLILTIIFYIKESKQLITLIEKSAEPETKEVSQEQPQLQQL